MPVIIAHRGASGYLPEHTLPAKALAYAMAADYLEQDVVATRDDELVVLHDVFLDRVTDVASRYPGRQRSDGRYYVRDFDLDELRSLNVTERMNADGSPVYPGRFPVRTGRFRIHTLDEEIEFIQSLNKATGRTVGIYPEIKRPAWHRDQGTDITPRLLETLTRFGYTGPGDAVFVQCFDERELQRIRREFGCTLKLVQLIGDNSWQESATDFDELRTRTGLERLAATVEAIGPWIEQLYRLDDSSQRPVSSGVAEAAHAAGLELHPYTFRADDLPAAFSSFDELVGFCVGELGVDGLFTDFPDRARQAAALRA